MRMYGSRQTVLFKILNRMAVESPIFIWSLFDFVFIIWTNIEKYDTYTNSGVMTTCRIIMPISYYVIHFLYHREINIEYWSYFSKKLLPWLITSLLHMQIQSDFVDIHSDTIDNVGMIQFAYTHIYSQSWHNSLTRWGYII